ncbi:acetate--CoA ligase family protein [Chachezhania antarctica]|uniref:acetate--CoA ligase family protein n=1 Tax=Chachezhania antarctica TaxID=2340860 RepID=UPI000EAF2550|nr:acetate--CoA ligase family protein [Chachezhania antarctica]
MTRAPYTRDDLLPLYDPKSVAVIGASPRPGSFGGRTIENLGGFDGTVYPVNEKYDEIGGHRCYPSLAALPTVPDLVVLTTPAASIEPLLEDCIAAGVSSVMVYASGFSEVATEEGQAAQARMASRAAEAGVRLLGPNCVGLLNYTSGARITFAGTPEGRLEGGPAIGLVCQSGALGFALVQAMERGVGFSHVVSCGNSSDVDVADWVSALAAEPTCSAIACAFEGVADPRKFLAAAEAAWAADKPLIVYKMAVGEEGAAAAMSHTASLAGSAVLWEAVFDKGGAVSVQDFDALIETAWFFAKAPAAKGDGAAMLSGSGGAAIMSADFAEIVGVPMPQPAPDVVARLEDLIPPFVPARNPCDVTAGVINDMDTLLNCADALLGDPHYATLIYGYAYAYETATKRQPRLSELAAKHGKPITYVWLTQLLEGPGRVQAERDPNVAVIGSMRRAFEIIRAWTDRAKRRAATAAVGAGQPTNRDAAAKLLAAATGRALGEQASKSILAEYGIPVPQERLVQSAAEAAEAATAFGLTLALKVDSADILHKSDAGGVVLNVQGPDAAGAAYDRIMAACRRAHPDATIDGVLVQEMVPAGLEIIAGFRNAEGFGPVLTCGLGGVLTEVLADTVSALAPVSVDEAEGMLRSLRGARLFDGYRGAPAVDLRAVAGAVAALSQIAMDFPDDLAEFDVNPLICLPDRCVAVDGLAVLAGRD